MAETPSFLIFQYEIKVNVKDKVEDEDKGKKERLEHESYVVLDLALCLRVGKMLASATCRVRVTSH